MATSPLNRWPSTNIGQIRSAPPAAKRTTPSQRMVSPSRVQNPARSVHAGRKASSSPISAKTTMTQRSARSSRTPELRFPPLKSITPDSTKKSDRKNNQGRVGEEGGKPAPAEDGEPEIARAATTIVTRVSLGVGVTGASHRIPIAENLAHWLLLCRFLG